MSLAELRPAVGPDNIPTADELIIRARALAPRLRDRAVKAERDRNIPQWAAGNDCILDAKHARESSRQKGAQVRRAKLLAERASTHAARCLIPADRPGDVRRGELINIVAHFDSDSWAEESWTRECDLSELTTTYAGATMSVASCDDGKSRERTSRYAGTNSQASRPPCCASAAGSEVTGAQLASY